MLNDGDNAQLEKHIHLENTYLCGMRLWGKKQVIIKRKTAL